jgi:hypothetical protein
LADQFDPQEEKDKPQEEQGAPNQNAPVRSFWKKSPIPLRSIGFLVFPVALIPLLAVLHRPGDRRIIHHHHHTCRL